jgi:hypothetical protein
MRSMFTSSVGFLGSINMLGNTKRLDVPILHASTSKVFVDP